jgi:hypothetical protein
MDPQTVVVNDPQQDEDETAPDNPGQQPAAGRSLFQLPANGIGCSYPRDKEEERKDEIIEMKAIPGGMLELVGNSLPERAAGIFGDRVENLFSAHDPEHIESPQGIE